MSSNQFTEAQYHSDIKTLLEFINRLGNSARGINRDIDHKLSKIKSLSDSGLEGLAQLEILFQQVSTALQREQGQLEHRLSKAHKQAAQAVQVLVGSEHIQPTHKERLITLVERTGAPLYSYSELLPLLGDVVSLYREILESKQTKESSDSNLQPEQIQSELSNILATIDFRGQASSTLQQLREKLLKKLNTQELLVCCVDALRLLIRGVNEERQSAQQFLLSLNEALGSVGKALAHAVQTHESSSNQHSNLSEQLQQQVNALSESVQSSQSLQQLKQSVHQHVANISDTLMVKLALEANERQRLHAELLSMQSRLEDVESEALMYKRKLSEQKFKSLQDSLTRLPNRAAFEERLQLEYQRWQSYAAPLSIAVADIDNFKVINDTFGHTAGDKTLQVIANMLKKSLRDTDFICRYGGEEFVIIFPQTTPDVAFELLEKARYRVKSIPFKFKQESISITISAGVSSFTASDSPHRVFERADRALYEAKDSGRDRVCQQ